MRTNIFPNCKYVDKRMFNFSNIIRMCLKGGLHVTDERFTMDCWRTVKVVVLRAFNDHANCLTKDFRRRLLSCK